MNGLPICGKCQQAMSETYAVAVIFLDLQENPAFIRYSDEFQCPSCGHKVVTGFAPYIAYSTDTDFQDAMSRAQIFPEEVRYVFPRSVLSKRSE